MYTITSEPGGREATANTISDALTALMKQLLIGLPDGGVTWCIVDPRGEEHRGWSSLNGQIDVLEEHVDQLAAELYTQLHRSNDGGPPQVRQIV